MKFRVVLLWCFFTAFASAEEAILSFDSRIEIQLDGDLLVTETLQVSAEQNKIRHGIYRDFPKLYLGRSGLHEKRSFDVLEVSRDGAPEPYALENHKAGSRLRMGSKDTDLTTGVYTYVIRYRTSRQLTSFDSHDELYWNVTGNEWDFPILEAKAKVILPAGIPLLSLEGYLGPEGSKEQPAAGKSNPPNELSAGRPLAPGEGFTIAATWAAKSLDPAAYPSTTAILIKDNSSLLAGAGLLLVMLGWHIFSWFRVGRDPAPGLIIPQFEPPAGWSPAAVRMLSRMGFDNTCFSAAVMGLAVKKRLTISGTGKTTSLERSEIPPQEPLTTDENALFTALLGENKHLKLVQSNHQIVAAGRTALQTSLRASLEKSHFRRNLLHWIPGFLIALAAVGLSLLGSPEPEGAGFIIFWLSMWSLGTGALFSAALSSFRSGTLGVALLKSLVALPFALAWIAGIVFLFVSAGPFVSVIFVVAVLSNFMFFRWIKAPTPLGRKILDHIDGFRHYLSVAEEDRLRGFEGPEKTPELFEKFLPYAHALNVEQAWSRKFSTVLAAAAASPDHGSDGYRPSFYTGSHTGFDGAMTAAALGGALTSALTTAGTAPSSSGSGSGSGGGGSSGGGGGGGGGGGW